MEVLKGFPVKQFNQDLLAWYQENKRILPWRKTRNPYYIWISEIMCQQTKVVTAIPYYERFITIYPTVDKLAQASEVEILKMWEGLGYYSRARNIHQAAKTINNDLNGVFPSDYNSIIKLKGIGSYTAGAISSIAFSQTISCVDGNVMRVMSRILEIYEDVSRQKTKTLFENIVSDIMDSSDPSSYNQGLMELGALICTPRGQICLICPVKNHCKSFKKGDDHLLPIKTTKTKQKRHQFITGVIRDNEGRILMRKRPSEGLLGGLWEFIQVEGKEVKELMDYLNNYEITILEDNLFVCEEKHAFSHLIWNMRIFLLNIETYQNIPDTYQFFSKEELNEIPIATAHKKIFKYL